MHSGQSPDLVTVPEGPIGARCVRTSVPALFSFFNVALRPQAGPYELFGPGSPGQAPRLSHRLISKHGA